MYKCIYGFSVEMVDENGFSVENERVAIEEGTVWSIPDDENYRFIGGEVRLENKKLGWIEISKDLFDMFFEKVQ